MGRRFNIVLKQLPEANCETIPLACQDWANAKAAYRFFSNDRVTEADILAGHVRPLDTGAVYRRGWDWQTGNPPEKAIVVSMGTMATSRMAP